MLASFISLAVNQVNIINTVNRVDGVNRINSPTLAGSTRPATPNFLF